MENKRSVISNIYKSLQTQHREKYEWEEFLDLLGKKPKKVLRNIFQYTADLLDYYVGDGLDEYIQDPESVRYLYYDTSQLLESEYEPFFADRLFSNRFIDTFRNIKGTMQNKVYVLEGPAGCGKSTFLNNLLDSFERYNTTEDGLLLNIKWEIDTTEFDLNDSEVSSLVQIPCPNHDNPITLIPKENRKEVLDSLIEDEEIKKEIFESKCYEWIFHKECCAICSSIFQSLLDTFGDIEKVFSFVKAQRVSFNKKLGDGISVFYPSDGSQTEIREDKVIQEQLDKIFKNQSIPYKFTEFGKVNNGIYCLMDVISNNRERFDNLHGIVSEGVHKLGDIEESSDAIFIVVSDDIDDLCDQESWIDRLESLHMNYILDVETEKKIFRSKFGEEIDKYFMPEILESFIKSILYTRLDRENRAITSNWIKNKSKYTPYCDSGMQLLKLEIYGGKIPQWLTEEDRKNFTYTIRQEILDKSKFDGKQGISERQAIELFSDFFQKYSSNEEEIDIIHLVKYIKSNAEKFGTGADAIYAILRNYNYTVLQHVKESLYSYNTEKITQQIKNYLCALNYEIGTSIYCKFTGEQFVLTENFMDSIEEWLFQSESVSENEIQEFRNRHLRKLISETQRDIDMNNKDISETEQFKELYNRYAYNLKIKALEPLNETYRHAIKDYNSSQFHSYEDGVKDTVRLLIINLIENNGYTVDGAIKVCLYVIDYDIPKEFDFDQDKNENTRLGYGGDDDSEFRGPFQQMPFFSPN